MKAKNSIDRADFVIISAPYGRAKVTYTSPVTGKKWMYISNYTELIDRVRDENRTKAHLTELKRIVKTYGRPVIIED